MGNGYAMRIKAAEEAAEILIYEDIGENWMGDGVTAKQFALDLKQLGKVRQIDVRINSNGGDAFDGIAIYRQLVQHTANITTHIDGLAASAASIIAMAGNQIQISESGFLMIHDASGLAMGNAKDLRELADILETVSVSTADVYVARTNNSLADVRMWMEAETWFDGKDAVAKGFADSIMENLKVAACLDPRRYKYRHVPMHLVAEPTSTPPLRVPNAARDKVRRMRADLDLQVAKSA